LGIPHPDYLLACLTSRQISEWIAFSELEPFGEQIDWLRTGVLASLIANVNRQKGAKPFKPTDFMPEEPKLISQSESTETMKSKILELFGLKEQ
jgi:hypothetical protein